MRKFNGEKIKMRAALFIFCLIAVSSAEWATSDYGVIEGKSCNNPPTGYSVTSFEVTPNPPQKNKDIYFDMTGTVANDEDLTGMLVYVLFYNVQIFTETLPLSVDCSAGTTCEVKLTVYLPGIAPSGSYNIRVELQDSNKNLLMCWLFPFDL